MRRFELLRIEDQTGVSGTGVVAQGIEYPAGDCVMEWLTPVSTTVIATNIRKVAFIHGHAGKTRVIFPDQPVESGDHCIVRWGELAGMTGVVEFSPTSYVIANDGSHQPLGWLLPEGEEYPTIVGKEYLVAVHPIVVDYFDVSKDMW